jgi:hypothetical protein
MDVLRGLFDCCPEAFWWFSALLTPSLIAMLPVASAQKSGRS